MNSKNFSRLLLVSACLLTFSPTVYAANGYTLEEVTPIVSPTPHGSIIKTEVDAVTGQLTQHQYKINATYESASTTNYNYYKWGGTSLTTGTDTDYDVKIGTDTIHTNLDDGLTGDVVDKNFINLTSISRGAAFYNSTSTAGYNITANFIGNYFNIAHSSSIQGGAFWNSKILGDVTGDFLGNYVTNTDTGSAWGGAVYNEGTVAKIAGNFVGNFTVAEKSGNSVGGAIFNSSGKISLIEGNFISNFSTANTGFALAGAIYSNGTSAEITTINANFKDNYVLTNATDNIAQGGAIHNTKIIETLTGDFTGNHALSPNNQASGGAIANCVNGKITTLTGDFIGNYVNSKNNAFGGAIYNLDYIHNLEADFKQNYTKAEDTDAKGGAIYNSIDEDYAVGVIDFITGDFSGNYTEGDVSQGGSIYNSGEITNIIGNFAENYAKGSKITYGGAIYNTGNITDISGNFTENYARSTGSAAYGGAIYNYGTIGDITNAVFDGNYSRTSASNSLGGAIANYVTDAGETTSISNITGEFKNNYAMATGSQHAAYGGAINNSIKGAAGGSATIGTITANFTNNYTSTTKFESFGGAIYNKKGSNSSTVTIDNIIGDFIGNYATSTDGDVAGGAIYNTGEISNITGTFTGNYVKSENGTALGGAIYNEGIIGLKDVIFSAVTDAERTNGILNDIYNLGTINVSSVNGVNNFATEIYNDGTINFAGESILNTSITGNGNLAIGNGTNNSILTLNTSHSISDTQNINLAENSQLNIAGGTVGIDNSDNWSGKINLTDGTLNITDGSVKTGSLTQTGGATNIISNTIINANDSITGGNLVLGDGTGSADTVITVTGGTLTTGDTNTNLTINSDVLLDIQGGTVTLDGGAAYDKVTWDGDVQLNGGSLILSHIVDTTRTDATHPTANKTGALIANNGNLTIDSTSVLLGNGDIIADDVVLNLAGNLQIGKENSSDSADVTIDGTTDTWTSGNIVLSNGNLTVENVETSTDKTLQANGGNLILNGTTVLNNANDIIAKEVAATINGTLNIQNGSVTLDSNDGGTGTINNDTSTGLLLVGGTLTNTIIGNGTTEIQGAVVNNGSIIQNVINITSGSLETNADNVNANIINNSGTRVILTGGTNNSVIDGDGNTEITGTVTNNAAIAQDYLKITNNGEFKTALNLLETNQITNDGKFTVTSGNQFDLEIDGNGEILLNSGNMKLNTNIIGNTVVQNSLGTITFADSATNIANANLQLNANNGTINLVDGAYNELVTKNLILNTSNVNINVDSNLVEEAIDSLNVTGFTNSSNGIITINPNLPTNITDILTNDNIVLNPISNSVSESVKNGLASSIQMVLPNKIISPIYQYTPAYDPITGLLTVGIAATGGNDSYKSYNPAVFSSAVAAQTGGYFTMLNAYDHAFNNMDMRMNLSLEERRVMKMRNRYAYDGANLRTFSPNQLVEDQKGAWVRPYASFERVGFRNGPNVNNVMYGTFIGGDSDIIELKNGWDLVYSGYAAYNGSHQTYDGISIYQNGGQIGGTAVWYKDNFFTGLTLSTGASVAEASSMYGSEDITMLMAGVASKTGYNWELAKGKFIIQPNWLMSYTFVNTFDYTNAAGVRMDSSPLHAIQLAPGVKFIGNLPHGWQPYLGVQMVWNIMDDTRINAAEVSLPQLSTKPYVQYGVGVQKRWGERCTGFFQTMLRNGGRTGVALSLGFKMTFGKGSKADKKSENITPKTKKASLELNNIK